MSTLLHNLRALRRRDPSLTQRLLEPMATEHVVQGQSGPELLLYRQRHALTVQPELPELPQGRVRVFGVGLGEQVLAALDAGHRVMAWDRDPLMLRLLLSARPLQQALESGDLCLLLGADLWGDADPWHLEHPLLAQLYSLERQARGCSGPAALVVPGGLFVEDLAHALREQGYTPWPLLAQSTSPLESEHTLERTQAELVLSVGYLPGLPEALEAKGVPHLIWEIDPALDHPAPATGPVTLTQVFSYREAHVPLFKAAGLRARFLALAANPQVRTPMVLSPSQAARYGAPVVFVGASMQETAQRYRRTVLGLLRRAGRAPEELERWLQEQAASPWRFTIGPHLEGLQALAPELDLRVLVGEIAAAQQRMDFVRELLPLGLQVWGDRGWASIGRAWRGLAGHRLALTQIYNGAQVNVDIGRVYQGDILTMRVFDVLACGGLLVTQDSPELRALFTPGEHLLVARDPQEMAAQVAWALAHPKQAARIAAAGRREVLAKHCISHRLNAMLAELPKVQARSNPGVRPALGGLRRAG